MGAATASVSPAGYVTQSSSCRAGEHHPRATAGSAAAGNSASKCVNPSGTSGARIDATRVASSCVAAGDSEERIAGSLARQLRDMCCRKAEYPFRDIQCRIQAWRQDPGLDPSAYVNIGNANGKTALHLAAQLRDDGSAKFLLACEADVNAVTARGRTALIYAAARGRLDVLRTLLEGGARCRVRTATGDTAVSMVRLSCEVRKATGEIADDMASVSQEALELLLAAEQGEQHPWLNFSEDATALAAQAEHARKHPSKARFAKDMPPAVADLVDLQRKAEEARATADQESDEAQARQFGSKLAAMFGEAVNERDADPGWRGVGLADALIEAACTMDRKRALPVLREALRIAFDAPDAGGLANCAARLLQTVGTTLTAAEERLVSSGRAGSRRAKLAKATATSAILSSLRDLVPCEQVPIAMLATTAPGWMAIELTTPPKGIQFPDDVEALLEVLGKVCHREAWGSNFGAALRWLRGLRPADTDPAAAMQSFERLAAVYASAYVAAMPGHKPMRRHVRDGLSGPGRFLTELREVLGDDAFSSVQAAVAAEGTEKVSVPRVCDTPAAAVIPSAAPFLQLPQSARVLWVDTADDWDAVAAELKHAPKVAMDTEWYDVGDGPSLVQLALGRGLVGASCYLIDMFAPAPRRGLASALRDSFHGAEVLGWSFSEDRKRLQELVAKEGQLLDSSEAIQQLQLQIMDLQPICCKTMGAPRSSSPSLSTACAALLGHPLDKRQQCSDWRRRPLSHEQLQYAALDAAVLLELHCKLFCGDEISSALV